MKGGKKMGYLNKDNGNQNFNNSLKHCNCQNHSNCSNRCSKKCCHQCQPCQCSCCGNVGGGGPIEINIFGFNTSGFTYVLSQGGKSIERAVSFSVFGIDFNSDGILPHPRTISGIVRRDGTIPSGSVGFTVSHAPNTGTYRVIFTKPFSIVSPDQEPTLEIIPDPVNVQVGRPGFGTGEGVTDVISGIISSEGAILDGTTLECSQQYAFTVEKNDCQPGFYRVRFKPELQVRTLLRGGIEISIIDLQVQSPGCCANNCSCNRKCTCRSSSSTGEVYSQGIDLPFVDRSGFIYRPYEITDVGKVYVDLPVSFSALLIREES